MPGFGIEDDELKKLFAEAEGAVMKVQHRPTAVAPVPVEPVLQPEPEPQPAAASVAEVAPLPAPAPPPPAPAPAPVAAPAAASAPPSGEPRRLAGGEQTGDGLVARAADGETINLPWGSVRGLTLGRVGERQWLGFTCGGVQYFFSDDGVVYKGLLKSLQSTSAMNWRGLVAELAAQVGDSGDAGVAVISGGAGGVIPKYQDKPSFWSAVTSKG